VDFAIHDRRVIIEVDGEHHFHPDRAAKDRIRDGWFEREGYRVVRINTGELSENFDGCVEEIIRAIGEFK
jgi:very-short-patch-repair endonuclease